MARSIKLADIEKGSIIRVEGTVEYPSNMTCLLEGERLDKQIAWWQSKQLDIPEAQKKPHYSFDMDDPQIKLDQDTPENRKLAKYMSESIFDVKDGGKRLTTRSPFAFNFAKRVEPGSSTIEAVEGLEGKKLQGPTKVSVVSQVKANKTGRHYLATVAIILEDGVPAEYVGTNIPGFTWASAPASESTSTAATTESEAEEPEDGFVDAGDDFDPSELWS